MLKFQNPLQDMLYNTLIGVVVGTLCNSIMEIAQGRLPTGYGLGFIGASLLAARWTRNLKSNEI